MKYVDVLPKVENALSEGEFEVFTSAHYEIGKIVELEQLAKQYLNRAGEAFAQGPKHDERAQWLRQEGMSIGERAKQMRGKYAEKHGKRAPGVV